MAASQDKLYVTLFEFEGKRDVMCSRSTGGPEEVRGHVQQINPKMKILKFWRIEDPQEFVAAKKAVKDDPNFGQVNMAEMTPKETTLITAEA